MSRKRLHDAGKRVRDAARRIDDKDVAGLASRGSDVRDRMDDVPRRLGRLCRDAWTLFCMVRDYWRGAYRQVPWRSIAMAAAAVIYFLSPVDAIPDAIPVIGYVDDAAVVGWCARAIRHDLARYRDWSATRVSSA